MAYSISITVEDGSTNIVQVPFPYLAEIDVHVFVNGVETDQSTLTWTSPSTIQLPVTAGSLAGATLVVQRKTPAIVPDVVYSGGGLDHNDLNGSVLQLLYFSQEQADAASLVGGTWLGAPPETVRMAQVWQALADPACVAYDPTFLVASNVPPTIPYHPAAVCLNGPILRLKDSGYYFIQLMRGLSTADMGVFFGQCQMYPLTPEEDLPVMQSSIPVVPTLVASMNQIWQGLADPLSGGYDPTSLVASSVPPKVPYNPAGVGLRSDLCRIGDSAYAFIQATLGLTPSEMGAFYTRCLSYPETP